MDFLHVDLTGLRGRHHPAITNIKTTDEVQKLRPHLKMLCGNLLTYGMKYDQSGQEFSEILETSKNSLKIEEFSNCEVALTQLVLDPSSMNLHARVHMADPVLPELFKVSHDLCAAICKRRLNLLNGLKKKSEVISS